MLRAQVTLLENTLRLPQPGISFRKKSHLKWSHISLGRKLELRLSQGSSINYCSHCTMKDQTLWISFNWLLISYVITYSCAEMPSDVLDAFDYSCWQLGLKTVGTHFLICNGLPWCANKNRWQDEWSWFACLLCYWAAAQLLLWRHLPWGTSCQWKREKLQRAWGFTACKSTLLSAPRQGESREQGLGGHGQRNRPH